MGLHFSKEEFSNRKEKTLNSMKNEGITSKNGYAIPKLSYIAGDSSLGDSISFLSRVRLHECFPQKTLI